MARSTFYYHIRRIGQSDGYDDLRAHIRKIYDQHKGRYGYRRVTIELRDDGVIINHKTVRKLMVGMSLKAKRRNQHYRSYKGNVGKIAPNVINRNFCADAPNKKWATDVTQVNIKDRKVFLSPILDMFNGEIISYAISYIPNMEMVQTMLKKAFNKNGDLSGLILHSDQGWQYQQRSYQDMLKEKGIIQSMSRKGNCLDNSMMENFFGIMKSELLYLREWKSVEEFVKELKAYIRYYNNNRIKLRLKGKSPVQYRTLYQISSELIVQLLGCTSVPTVSFFKLTA